MTSVHLSWPPFFIGFTTGGLHQDIFQPRQPGQHSMLSLQIYCNNLFVMTVIVWTLFTYFWQCRFRAGSIQCVVNKQQWRKDRTLPEKQTKNIPLELCHIIKLPHHFKKFVDPYNLNRYQLRQIHEFLRGFASLKIQTIIGAFYMEADGTNQL